MQSVWLHTKLWETTTLCAKPPQAIGEHFSSLANSSCLAGKVYGYLVFGIDDTSHDVVGI